MLINILGNIIKKNNLIIIFNKIIKRFEKNTSIDAKLWANSYVQMTTDKFLKEIDANLYNESIAVINEIVLQSKKKLDSINISLGGGGNYLLLYFLVRKFRPKIILETGVAAGWSTLAILKAINKNKLGKLYSSDFPYFRIKNPEQYIGILAKDEKNKKDWYLDIDGDDIALPKILKILQNENINLIHYDSDKTYYARNKALKILSSKLNSETIIIFDDIQDNLHFKDLVEKTKEDFSVLEFQNKYVGIILKGKNNEY